MLDSIPPVLIVGAGPTGMTAALDLAHYGIPSLVLDKDQRLSDGSRALAFHQSALSVWEKLGAAEPILAKGIAWSRRHTFHGEKRLYVQDFGQAPPGYLPRYINISQFDVETCLVERIKANPLIDLRWDHRVTGLKQDAGSVTLDVETPHGAQQLNGQYLLACDGAHSTLRKLMGLDFPGRTFNDYFLIADIRADLNFPHEPRFFFNHPTNRGQTVLIHPQPESVWRIDWQIGAQADTTAEMAPKKIDQRIRALIGSTPYEIVWLSAYRFHQRMLVQFRHGRVFFAGDAAHLVAPFGARGMNSAIQDIENLVWKLAFVLKGLAPDKLLDTYQLERWPAQAENQRVTINTMRFMAPDTAWLRLRRDFILWLSSYYEPARKWVDSGKMSVPFVYAGSPLVTPDYPGESWLAAPILGDKPPDLPLTILNARRPGITCLRHLCGSGFAALYFDPQAAQTHEFLAAQAELQDLPLTIHPVLQTTAAVGQTAILDHDGSLAGTLAAPPGSLYLLRPDGHIALRRQAGKPLDLSNYFDTLKRS